MNADVGSQVAISFVEKFEAQVQFGLLNALPEVVVDSICHGSPFGASVSPLLGKSLEG